MRTPMRPKSPFIGAEFATRYSHAPQLGHASPGARCSLSSRAETRFSNSSTRFGVARRAFHSAYLSNIASRSFTPGRAISNLSYSRHSPQRALFTVSATTPSNKRCIIPPASLPAFAMTRRYFAIASSVFGVSTSKSGIESLRVDLSSRDRSNSWTNSCAAVNVKAVHG